MIVSVVGLATACGGGTGGFPEEALALDLADQAGLYGAVAAEIARRAPENAMLSGTEAPRRFFVVDRPTADFGSLDENPLPRFDQGVLDAIEAGLGGDVTFMSDRQDGLIRGAYGIPITTVPGDTGPDNTTVEGPIAPEGSLLVTFGLPYSAWGGGFTGGEWPSDADLSVDLVASVYQSPSVSWFHTPGVEKRDGEWRVAGYRTMGTVANTTVPPDS